MVGKNIGIYKLSSEAGAAGPPNIRKLRAEMYMENMSFDFANPGY